MSDPLDPKFLSIVMYPHKALLAKALPVANFGEDIRQISERMLDLLHDAAGLGLAANQVGLPIRMFVARLAGMPSVYVNPEIIQHSEECSSAREGCLSWPGNTRFVRRYKAITIRFQDLEGVEHERNSSGLSARCWQHELDHLNGINIADDRAGVQ